MRKKALFLAAVICAAFCTGCADDGEESSRKRRNRSSDEDSVSSVEELSSEAEPDENSENDSTEESQPDSPRVPDTLVRELKSGGPYYAYDSDSDCYLVMTFGGSDRYLFEDADYLIRGYSTGGEEAKFYWNRVAPDSCYSEGYINDWSESYVELREPGYIRGNLAEGNYRLIRFTRNSDSSWDDGEGHTFKPGQPNFDGETAPADQGDSQNPQTVYDWSNAANWDYQVEDGARAAVRLPNARNNTLTLDVSKPGPNPWSVQGKYLNITLEHGCRYRVSFEYKTRTYREGAGYDPDAHHALISLIQNYEPFEPYFEVTMKLNRSDFTNASYEFTMNSPTDRNVFAGFGFGGIGDAGCYAEIRNFRIEKIDNPVISAAEVVYDWRNIMKWDCYVEDGAAANITLPMPDQDGLVFDISKSGPNPWSVQGKYLDVALHQGCRYRVSFEYKASTYNESAGYDPNAHHALISLLQNYEPYEPYFEATMKLNHSTFTEVSYEFTMNSPTDYNVFCAFGFGALGNTSCHAEIRNFRIQKLS